MMLQESHMSLFGKLHATTLYSTPRLSLDSWFKVYTSVLLVLPINLSLANIIGNLNNYEKNDDEGGNNCDWVLQTSSVIIKMVRSLIGMMGAPWFDCTPLEAFLLEIQRHFSACHWISRRFCFSVSRLHHPKLQHRKNWEWPTLAFHFHACPVSIKA